MKIVQTIPDLRAALKGQGRPAFVATMGNLHDGHLSLVRQAKTLADVSVASIFVNRLQFLPTEDFNTYPRTWEADCASLTGVGCDILFAPQEQDLYPKPQVYKVQPDPQIADILEGQFRPGFFVGVCTVVMKLFSAVFATTGDGVALFGKKDYQQLMVIRRMVEQFALPIEIVAGGTRRDPDGLAMSSRNGYLTAEERTQATALSQILRYLALNVRSDNRSLAALEAEAVESLNAKGWVCDYLTVRRRHDLQLPTGVELELDTPLVALGAARLGNTRLIDNVEF